MNRKAVLILITLLSTLALSACGNGGGSGGGGGGGNVGITLITINAAGDSFAMGDDTYGPQPNVTQTISYNFKMSKHEITNAQFQAFIDDGGYADSSYWTTNGWVWKGSIIEPLYWANPSYNGSSQPVVGVSWYEAVAFSNWLSVKEGLTPAYDSAGRIVSLTANGYRLPTEVEWEYAAAKGQPGASERRYAWGNTWDCAKAVGSAAPCSNSTTADVGSTSPNGDTPQGLADMSGNVWEWASDNDGGISGATDWYSFAGDVPDTFFIVRGGSWISTYEYVFRGASRMENSVEFFDSLTTTRISSLGFRVVRPIP